jgi:hypothetical protein
MAHSIELLLDPDSDAAIRLLWQRLVDAGLPSNQNIRSGTNRPHITLVAAERISPDVDESLAELAADFPVPCLIGAPMVFGRGRLTLVRCIVPSTSLLTLHDEVYRKCLPHLPAGPFVHCAPGQWSPHTTLGRRFTPEQISDAIANVAQISHVIPAQAVGLRRWDSDLRVEHQLIRHAACDVAGGADETSPAEPATPSDHDR